MIIADRYSNAFTEVYAIIQCLNKDEYKKISLDLINTIKDNRNVNYIYKLIPDKKLKEQVMLPETKALLFNIFRDYLSTEEEKIKIKKLQLERLKKIEEAKQLKHNIDFFKNKNIENITNLSTKNVQLIELKQQSILKKIINTITNFFRK